MTEHSTNGDASTASNLLIRDKILKVLEIYPRISPSMLQIGIGSSLPTSIWRPVLLQMIQEGIVIQDDVVALSATDRNQVYKVIHLSHLNLTNGAM